MLAVEFLRRAIRGRIFHLVVPPDVTIGNHRDIATGSLNHHNLLHRRRLLQARIDRSLQRNLFAATPPAVRSNDQLRLGIIVPIGNGIGTKAAEDDGVNRPQSSAREHRDREFRNHRHVDSDAITGLNAQPLQHVGKLADLTMQILKRQHPRVARFPFPDDRGLVLPPRIKMPIQALIRRVNHPALEPLGVRHLTVQHRVPLLEPIQVLRHLTPKRGRIILGHLPHLLILLLRRDVSIRRKLSRRRELAVFLKN